MVQFLQQLPALAGVVVGALASYLATSAAERARWRRSQSVRWDERRVDAYADFSHALKRCLMLSQRIAASSGYASAAQPIEPAVGLDLLAKAEEGRASQWERVLLLGDAATIEAAREWLVEGWRMEWFARGLLTGEAGWLDACESGKACRQRFYDAARRDLGIHAKFPPDTPSPRFPRAAP